MHTANALGISGYMYCSAEWQRVGTKRAAVNGIESVQNNRSLIRPAAGGSVASC